MLLQQHIDLTIDVGGAAYTVGSNDTFATIAKRLSDALNADDAFSTHYVASVDPIASADVIVQRLDGTAMDNGDLVVVSDGATLTRGTADVVTIDNTSVTTRDNAQKAIVAIDNALNEVSRDRANLGAFQNRLEHAVSNMMNMSGNTADARSVITDADYAQESSSLAKNQMLQQAGTAMLAQSNAQSLTVLSLLK